MKKLALALSCAFVALSSSAFSQTYSVSGSGGAIPGTPGGGGGGNAGTVLPTDVASFPLSTPVPATALTIDRVILTGLTHTWVGDVQLVLWDPTDTIGYNLVSRLGLLTPGASCCGFSCDFGGNYTIVGAADPSINSAWPTGSCAGATVIPGGIYPQSPGVWVDGSASVFNLDIGSIPAVPGIWTLRAYDGAGGDTGALVSWTMEGSEYMLAANIDIDALAGAGAGVPSAAYGGAGLAGAWNSISATPTAAALVDVSGNPTPATISGGVGAGNFAFNNAATSGDDELLLDDVADIGGVGASRVYTISGLPTGVYEVTVYAWAPDDRVNFLTNVTVSGGPAGTQTCGGAGWSGTHVEGTTFVRDFPLVTSGSMTITVATAAGFGSLNGMQIRQLDTNPGPQAYCVVGASITPCAATLGATGTPSVSAVSGFTVAMTNADPMRNGGMFYALTPASIPFGTGSAVLCTGTPRRRLFSPPTNTFGAGLCGGGISIDLAAFIAANPGTLGAPFSSGDTIYVQGWFRDPGNGTKNLATSNGLAVTFTP